MNYFKDYKKLVAFVVLTNFTLIKANVIKDLKLHDSSIATNVLEKMEIFKPSTHNPVVPPTYIEMNSIIDENDVGHTLVDITNIRDNLKGSLLNWGNFFKFHANNAVTLERRKTDLKNFLKDVSFNILFVLELTIAHKLNELAVNGTLSGYDALISKLPTKTQDRYKNLTDKINSSLNTIIEKTYGADKKLSDRTTLDKIKILAKRLILRYSNEALTIFCISALRSMFHSKFDTNNAKKIAQYSLLPISPEKKSNHEYSHYAIITLYILNILKEEIAYAFLGYNELNLSNFEEMNQRAEDNIKILEIIDPALAEEFKKEFELFKESQQKSLEKKNDSPLRSIGNFIIKIFSIAAISEGQFRASNYITNNYSNKLGINKK